MSVELLGLARHEVEQREAPVVASERDASPVAEVGHRGDLRRHRERRRVVAEPPEVVPLEVAQVLGATLGPLRVEQLQHAPDVRGLPRLLRDDHVRHVEKLSVERRLPYGDLSLLDRAPPLGLGDPLLFERAAARLLRVLALPLGLVLLLDGEALRVDGALSLALGLGERPSRLGRALVGADRGGARAIPLGDGGEGEAADEHDDDRGDARGQQQAAPVRGALAATLGVGHVRANPRLVEHAVVDPVSYSQQAVDGSRDTGEPDRVDERARLVVEHAPAAPDIRVEVEHAGDVVDALEQPLAHEHEVMIALPGAVREEQVFTYTIDAAGRRDGAVRGDLATEELCQIRMAAGP